MASKKTTKAAPKSKAPSKKTPKPAVNKSQFIRDNASLPPQEIVAKAKKQGIDLSIAMVYTILSEYRKKQRKSPSKASAARPGTSAKPTGSHKEAEATFGALILRLGVERAQELFDQTKAKVENSLK